MSEKSPLPERDQAVEKLNSYLNRIKENKNKLLIFNGVVAVLTLLILFFIVRPYYTSSITILPDFGRKPAFNQLSDLASLAGINVREGAGTEIYQNLLTAETVLAPAIFDKYKTEEFSDSVNLIDYFEIDNYSSDPIEIRKRKRFLKVKKNLIRKIQTQLDKKTKILKISVTMPESKLSADVVNRIVKSLDNYLRTKTKTYASERRLYIEKRIKQVSDSLGIVENKLKDFRERNRVILSSPALLLKQTRLLRNVKIMQSVYIELNKQLELAKIDEVKDTPILNVREYAQDPVKKAGPKRAIIFIVVIILSLILSMLLMLFYSKVVNYIYKIIRTK